MQQLRFAFEKADGLCLNIDGGSKPLFVLAYGYVGSNAIGLYLGNHFLCFFTAIFLICNGFLNQTLELADSIFQLFIGFLDVVLLTADTGQ